MFASEEVGRIAAGYYARGFLLKTDLRTNNV
jgi:hypothetical protein